MMGIGMVIPQDEQTLDQKENLHFLGIGNPLLGQCRVWSPCANSFHLHPGNEYTTPHPKR
jgi:hypothetical protein